MCEAAHLPRRMRLRSPSDLDSDAYIDYSRRSDRSNIEVLATGAEGGRAVGSSRRATELEALIGLPQCGQMVEPVGFWADMPRPSLRTGFTRRM